MTSPDAKNHLPGELNDPGPSRAVGPETPIVSSDVFVSGVKTPLSDEEYLKRIEALLKIVGLPPLAEFNRIEAEAAANKKAAKRRE